MAYSRLQNVFWVLVYGNKTCMPVNSNDFYYTQKSKNMNLFAAGAKIVPAYKFGSRAARLQ